ncbi:12674_t:CDS:2, partial [Gigaspora margarita]
MNSSYIGHDFDSFSSNEHIIYDTLPANRSYEIDTSSDGDFENELYTTAAIETIEGDISSDDLENGFDIAATIRNNKGNIFENKDSEGDISSDESENEPNIAATIRNAEDDLFENMDSGDEPKDSALKDIYTEQTFISFEIVRVEKEGDICVRKTYKCRHEGKYQPKKKLDHMENQEKIPTNIKDEIQFYVQECHFGARILKKILRIKFSDQEIYGRDLYNLINKFKADAQTKNDALTLYEHLLKLQQENSD